MRTFLIGGGRDAAAAHEPFARAAGGPVVAFILDSGPDTDPERWSSTLAAAGVPETSVVVVSPARPPTAADVTGAAGVYVAGGLTPAYRDALVGHPDWLDAARTGGLVYGGFSAGAAIAATNALVGGWRATVRGREIEVCAEECGEDLDPVTVLPGLGLVPFTVDVHAAQWGTLNRLVHALADGTEGWAIDEHTVLETDGDRIMIHGRGAATRARRTGDRVTLDVLLGGDPAVVRQPAGDAAAIQ